MIVTMVTEHQTPSLRPARVAPRMVGRYEILVRIASGGMATVYLARTRGTAGFERLFAVKLCHPHMLEQRAFVEMFLDEARVAALIHHPNVVPTVDLGTEEQLFLVMEYVEGGALSRMLTRAFESAAKRLPTAVTLRIALDALAGLHAAHEVRASDGRLLQLVHRDLSPHNVIVGVDGLSRITDFGIARAEARLHQTTGVRLKGKLAYMSPEQLEGNSAEIDRRADIFSAGVMLWEMLTGRRLFAAETPGAQAHALLNAPIPAPSMVHPELDRRLDPVILGALERDPDRRPATALELAESLEGVGLPAATHREVGELVGQLLAEDLQRLRDALAAEPGSVTLPVRLRRPRPPAPRRLLWLAVGLLCAALVAIGVSLWLSSRPNPAPNREPAVPAGPRSVARRAAAGAAADAAAPPRGVAPLPAGAPVDAGLPRLGDKRVRRRAPRRRRPVRRRAKKTKKTKKGERYQPNRI